MKAAQISSYGDASVVKIVEVEKPTIKPGRVLVEVHASSLNPFDTMVRAGYLKDAIPLELPVTLGGDIAGVIAEVGEDVEGFAVGDKVYGQANVVAGNSGAFAEYALTDSGQLAQAPAGLDMQALASLPLVGVSAWQAINDHIGLKSGQKIFIHGGAGGIGSVAIQIAKSLGAYVATTATGDGLDYAKALGADEVIDYKSADFTEQLRDYDAVFDTVGGDDFDRSLAVLRSGGVAVSMTAKAGEAKAGELGVRAITQSTHVTTQALDSLTELVTSGTVKPNVGKVYKLEDVSQAFADRESGAVSGKIVLSIK